MVSVSNHDVFISHAGEDKVALAAPIYERLKKLGMRGFLDRDELKVGGNAPQEMIDAMNTAPIGLFLLSPEFAMKSWTMKELFCFHRRRCKAVDASGEGANIIPVLIPVFYRLTVAESRHKNLFNDYAELAVRHHFFDRARSGDVDANVWSVSDALANLAVYTGIENDEGATNASTDEMKVKREELVNRICDEVGRVMTRLFAVPCNVPENSDDVTLDFEDAGNDEQGGSFEWRLLQEITREDVGSERRIVGVKGGAGVGKSCALRGVGRRDEVKFRFRSGVYYLSLGMDATVETLIGELLKSLRSCGEVKAAEELRSERRLDVVLEKVGEAMKGKKSLLLIDDLWQRNGLGPGTVDKVRQVLERDSGGVVVVTTRDTTVAAKGAVVVEIAPRGVFSAEAKRVLLSHANVKVEEITGAFQALLDEALQLCGGLPLCLAITGRGLRQLLLDAKCTGFKGLQEKLEIWERYLGMMQKGEKLVFEDVDDYRNVWTTLSVALAVLEELRGQYNGSDKGSHGLSWSQMHRSFCIMEKQSVVSFEVFARVWGLEGEEEALFVVKAFSGLGLADIVMGSAGRASGVRLHDLTHDFCVACAKKENEVSEWHRRMLEGYVREKGKAKRLREWWNVENDGYIYENLCRHLWRSGNVEELVELLLSRGWAEARVHRRSLLSWIRDFEECAEGIAASGKYRGDVREELQKGLRLVRDAVIESWTFLMKNRRELSFQVDARLFGCLERPVRKFVKSAREGEEKPYAKPLGRWWGRPGRRGRGGEFVLDSWVRAIALHDKRHLVVAGVERNVVFIDMEGMQVVRSCMGHVRDVESVVFNGDGTRAYSWSSDGVVREWDVGTGEEVRCIVLKNEGGNEGRASTFWCAAICPQTNVVVTGSRGGKVEMWDIQSGERIGEAVGAFSGRVECVSASRDGRRVVAGGEDGTLRIWDVSTRDQIGSVLSGHDLRVTCAVFSPDGQLVISASTDETIRAWEVESGRQRGNAIRGHENFVLCVCFSEDGRRIISGGDDRTIRIWDVATGAQVGRSLRGHADLVWCVAMTRDRRFVVSAGEDRTVRIWDLAAATDDAEELPEDASNVECLDVSVDGRWLVSGSRDGTVRVFDGSSGRQVGDVVHAHNSVVSCVAISPCGRRFVSGSHDWTLRVWDIRSRAQVGEPLHGHKNWVECVTYSPNAELIVSGSHDRTVRVWSTATHAQVWAAFGGGRERKLKRRRVMSGAVAHAQSAFSEADSHRGQCSDDHPVNTHRAWVTCVSVSADGERIVCGLENGGLCVWDVQSRKLVGARRTEHIARIVRLEMLEGNLVRSVDWYNVEIMWRLDEKEGLVRLKGGRDSVHEGSVGGGGGMNEALCVGRQVRVRGSDVQLATLPADVKGSLWRYSKASGILGVVLWDGRVVSLKIEW